jgi:putative Holliday junction resolvase
MAVDVGTRRIGLAVSDECRRVAFPLVTVQVTSLARALDRVAELAREQGATALVVGLPVNMDGSEGPSARRCRRAAALLEERSGLPVTLADERLTTAMAQRSLIEADVSRSRRREVIDQAAAVLLLRDHLGETPG